MFTPDLRPMASYKRGGSSLTCVPYRSSDRTLCTTPQSEPLSGSVESWQGCQGYPAQPDNITIDITFKGGMAGFGSLNGRLTYRRCESSTGSKGSSAAIVSRTGRPSEMRRKGVIRPRYRGNISYMRLLPSRPVVRVTSWSISAIGLFC
jgi:hypothetical protein